MTKAFLVYFKEKRDPVMTSIWSSGSQSASCGTTNSPYMLPDNRPLLIIAQNISDAAAKYPKSMSIQEIDVKDIVISDKVDYLLPQREKKND